MIPVIDWLILPDALIDPWGSLKSLLFPSVERRLYRGLGRGAVKDVPESFGLPAWDLR